MNLSTVKWAQWHKNVLRHKINTKKLKSDLVVSYDIQHGNGEGLFLFGSFINLSLTYLLIHLHTYSTGPTRGSLTDDLKRPDPKWPCRWLQPFETFLNFKSRKIQCIVATICLHAKWKAYMTSKFKCCFETEGFLKITGSQVHRRTCNVSQMVQDRDAVTTDQSTDRKWYMAYRSVPFPMTLSDFEGHAPIANLLKRVFCTVVRQLTRFQLT